MHNIYKLIAIAALCITLTAKAQTVSTFENLLPALDTVDNGKVSGKTFFSSGNAEFPVKYNTGGNYWESGVAISNKTDTVKTGISNLYSARTGKGYGNTLSYAVFQDKAIVRLTGNAAGKKTLGCYVTNGTYAYNSMLSGDAFAKKFGGASGNDPDFFLLTVKAYHNGALRSDSVRFYLADFRDANNANDYILKTWTWVDLTSLKNADSLLFLLSSSDNTAGFMNTPGFFCVDDFTTADIINAGITDNSNADITVYPNPCTTSFTLNRSSNSGVSIFNTTGELVYTSGTNNSNTINTEAWAKGIYFVKVEDELGTSYTKIIKQ